MSLNNVKIGFALTGSFCTFDKIIPIIGKLKEQGAFITPIFSEKVQITDTRYGKASEIMGKIINICENKPITSIVEAEPVGPKDLFDILVIAPATGNFIAKLANGIIDETTVMCAKAQLRNQKPVVIAISTNDALGLNCKNLATLINSKNIYFVPFRQDDPISKPNSLVAEYDLLIPTIVQALSGKQIQPLLLGSNV
ncbi:dipicolinate synthase subunit B [Caldicellulosiruptor changbaiensis]|uniref:Flavoprotein n=2 Tax=Caldicellulosiruptor TaxID=44000 RepID=A4XLE3_CALS8|nr:MULTISPECIES: dipicolinate synthase subunit B [Caldicellulosiruptor]ABP67728.1 flavoprotein [Caldicellulosiruptor saccharolyticus DSM 8903]AZT90126.1 dipicolinate synthase subunit B [Caldicellulosiruptor changbaiensis]